VKQHKFFLRFLPFLVGLALSACGTLSGGPLRTESRVVELEGAESVQVNITMEAGRLRLEGGSRALMEGAFTYNIQEWRPEVNYFVNGDTGILTIQQPPGIEINPQAGTSQYDWNLRFNNQVPIDLNTVLGAGEAVLYLGDINLTRLLVTTGAGSTILDLRKNWQDDLQVDITGGLGEVTLQLPTRTGVRLETSGLAMVNASDLERDGNVYVNQIFGQTENSLFITFQTGLGTLNVEMDS
jgi:hypothetical protein